MVRRFLNIIILVLLIIFQVSFINNLVFPFSQLNLILSFLIFLIMTADIYLTLKIALALGFLLEFYSAVNFGFILISIFLTLILLYLLFINFFTNKSFYSLMILGLIGSVAYYFIFILINKLFYFFNLNFFEYSFEPVSLIWSAGLNLVILTIFFFGYNFLTHELKSYFIYGK
ncbi:MAG TPA: hypothetical protein VGA49_02850 [Patescibacteria group bacterium]